MKSFGLKKWFLCFSWILNACAPTEIEDSRQKLLRAWGTEMLLPRYRQFEELSVQMDELAVDFCAEPTEEQLEDLRNMWWSARTPWKQTEVFAFGPYKESPWRLGPQIDFWPVRPDTIEEMLTQEDSLESDELGASAKGFPVIEYLLYVSKGNIVEEFQTSPKRCEYLLLVTADLLIRATEIRSAWDPEEGNYLGELVNAGNGSSTYDSLQMAVGEIVNRMAFTIENIRNDKLGAVLGLNSGGAVQPDKAESQFSGRSIQDIVNNLQGIESLYWGESGGVGLKHYLASRDRYFDIEMTDKLDACYRALDSISVPLTEAVVSEPQLVSDALEKLEQLQRLIQVDMLNALSITASFNDNDGD